MSGKVVGQVFDHYEPTATGGELLLAVKLADNAHDDGAHIFPSVQTLAASTRQSERTVQRHIGKMLAIGWLVLVREGKGPGRGGGYGRAREYRIHPDWIGQHNSALPVENRPTWVAKPLPKTKEWGDKMSPHLIGNGVTPEAKWGDIAVAERGDIAVSPYPSLTVIEPKNPLPPEGGADASKQNREPAATQPIPQAQATPQTERTGNSIAGTGQPVDPGDDGFAAFWRAYPKKVDEGKARKRWAEHRPDKPLQVLIVQAVRAWCAGDEWQRHNGQYIPKPSNWLHWKRWRDVPGTQAQSPAPIAYQPIPPREGAPMPPDVRAKVQAMLGRSTRSQPQEAAPCN